MLAFDFDGPIPTKPTALAGLVDALSGGRMDDTAAPFAWPAEVLAAAARLEFHRLTGSGREGGDVPRAVPESVLGRLVGTPAPFAFLVTWDDHEVTVAVGAPPGRAALLAEAVSRAIRGAPPVRLAAPAPRLEAAHFGCLAGIPAPAAMATKPVLDHLLDTLRGTSLVYLVFATPEPQESLRAEVARLRTASQEIERTYLQLGQQANIHRTAVRARDLLDAALARLDVGSGTGVWRVSALLGADSAAAMRQGLSLLAGSMQRTDGSGLSPLRAFECGRFGRLVHANLLHPAELSALCPLPTRDRTGYPVRDIVRFCVHHDGPREGVRLGTILDGHDLTPGSVVMPPDTWRRHAVIVGHTGSGKSTTARAILTDLSRRSIPFLVLEPAKAEYRRLQAEVPDLAVFRVGAVPEGHETPFQLNPFRFPEGFPLYTHCDFLKAAFTASFGLVPPTPYLLESAIHRAYESRGWDMATGRHPNGHDRLAFPTLSDLLDQVDPVVEAAGYDRELQRNLRAALRTRIGNLCSGPKGLALNTREDLPDDLLFRSPVVLELEHLGSDEEKAFVMGLAITRLYEFCRTTPDPTSGLRHLLVVEEAHRLLRRTAERSLEEGNMARQAVQSFSNLVAEVRAYGQGVLIVEQVPSLLAPEVIKHCGLKVAHRLPSKDDRDAVGDSMVLTEPQKGALALLPVGEAVVHGEGMAGAMHIRVPAPREPAAPGTARSPASLGRIPSDLARRLEGVVRRSRLNGILTSSDGVCAAERCVIGFEVGQDAATAVADLDAELSRLLARASSPPAVGVQELRRLFVEDALLRRALHYRWPSRDYDALLRCDLSTIGEMLRGLLDRRTGPHRWCDRCAVPCRLGYEGARVASDARVREEIEDVSALDEAAQGRLLLDIVRHGAERVLGWEAALPRGLAVCVIAHFLESAGASRSSMTAVLSRVMEAEGAC